MSLTLTIRTDKPIAELRLWSDDKLKVEKVWYAHKELSASILQQISNILKEVDCQAKDLTGIVVYKGPGSFTGLRIGITTANTLAFSLGIPLVGTTGENWQKLGTEGLTKNLNNKIVIPFYGGEANITKPKK